ncbi:MAG: VCBS repeat-containing protein, partial [Saprospiraceae bacterium]|nr:VCBS repeat-containing protein [Saprospiraceae bacterium]
MRRVVYVALTLMLAGACRQSDPGEIPAGQTMFTRLPASYTGVDFINQLEYTEEFNAYTYRNFYNGGGVAIGDINNDNLPDLYFCGNMRPNKLYLNRGELRFEDITDQAGVACPGVWSSGVSMADINGDGWLDIYVCKSGSPEGENRNNELFLNNGDGTFSERSEEYGLADLGLSSHAVFFDYDRDGDLDCYLLNNSIRPVGGYDIRPGQREVRDTLGGNKLYRNELINPQGQPRERFTDVSAEAGIYGSSIGFGLGVTVGDLNRDGWLDIYVSNDFFERDYLYLNNHDGTFSEVLEQQMREISLSSMGADLADINNDGWPDIFVTDMLPEGDARYKTKTSFENWDKYALNVRNGYFHQYTRNVLQLNNGDGTFSEIGRLANVFATDWSWGALMQDFDNDGWKDIFVANGIYKDLTDQDYINFYSDPNTVRAILSRKNAVIETMIDAIPSEPVPNYAFHNNGDLTFTDLAEAWGLGEPGFSNGSAYGDL